MAKTKVYRVEDPEGRGPYSSWNFPLGTLRHSRGLPYPERERTPVPDEDGMNPMEISAKEFFGFRSLGQLFEWFDGYAQEMHRHDYRIAVYEVDEEFVKYGVRQLVFEKGRAEDVGSLPLGFDGEQKKAEPAPKMHVEVLQNETRITTGNSTNVWKSYAPIQPRWSEDQQAKLEKQMELYKLAAETPLIQVNDFMSQVGGWDLKQTTPNIKTKVDPKVPDYTAVLRGNAQRWQRSGIAVKR